MPLFKTVQPVEDMLENSLPTLVRHIFDDQVVDSHERKEGGKDDCRKVVPSGSHEDCPGAFGSESTCCVE